MTITREEGQRRLGFNEAEGFILASAIRQLQKHYRVKVDDLPEHLRAYWKGRLSRNAATNEELEIDNELLADERSAWRSQREKLVQSWLADFQPGKAWEIVLDDDAMGDFLAILNDRRITLSVEHQISQVDMDKALDEITDAKLREVLFEIEILALFQMNCLASLEGEGHDEITDEPTD